MIEKIEEALRTVAEPEMAGDLVSLGMVEAICFKDGAATFTVRLTTPDCPFQERIRRDCEAAVSAVEGVSEVRVELKARADEKWREHPLFRGQAVTKE